MDVFIVFFTGGKIGVIRVITEGIPLRSEWIPIKARYMPRSPLLKWLSTEQAANSVGMSPDWIRKQIAEGRLVAHVWTTGGRPTYRIARADWDRFIETWRTRSDEILVVDSRGQKAP